jgi:predicted nucleotidyltransferase
VGRVWEVGFGKWCVWVVLLYLVKFLCLCGNVSIEGTLVRLLCLTPEGKIVLTLVHGKHTYGELKLETRLSDRWLTAKLEQLVAEAVVEKSGRWYGLASTVEVSDCELGLFLVYQAKRMAEKLASLPFVRAIVLFGSAAQRRAREYSDLDLIIVVTKPGVKAKGEIMDEVSWLESRYHLTIELLVLEEEDFLENVRSSEGGVIFGVAEGFEVLVDKTGVLGKILRDRVAEIKRSHEYLAEERIWLRVR